MFVFLTKLCSIGLYQTIIDTGPWAASFNSLKSRIFCRVAEFRGGDDSDKTAGHIGHVGCHGRNTTVAISKAEAKVSTGHSVSSWVVLLSYTKIGAYLCTKCGYFVLPIWWLEHQMDGKFSGCRWQLGFWFADDKQVGCRLGLIRLCQIRFKTDSVKCLVQKCCFWCVYGRFWGSEKIGAFLYNQNHSDDSFVSSLHFTEEDTAVAVHLGFDVLR